MQLHQTKLLIALVVLIACGVLLSAVMNAHRPVQFTSADANAEARLSEKYARLPMTVTTPGGTTIDGLIFVVTRDPLFPGNK
jgi:pyrroline-5-carboxylate reductase